jgi:hypothetical protein
MLEQLNSERKGGRGESPEPLVPSLRSPNRKPRFRAARRRAMKAQGVTPSNRLRLWNVQVTDIVIPNDILKASVRGLAGFWLRGPIARRLIRMDRNHGGFPTWFTAEYRLCEMCGRPLLGNEAERRREMATKYPDGRMRPCGDKCEEEQKSKLWQRLKAA